MNNKVFGIALAASIMITSGPAVVLADTREAEEIADITMEPAADIQEAELEVPAEETVEEIAEDQVPVEEAPVLEEEIAGPVLVEEAPEAELPETAEEAGIDTHREGTDIGCSLTLNNKVDGRVTDTIQYDPSIEAYDIQLGGVLNLKNVWQKYGLFKTVYSLKNGAAAFRAKSLVGKFTYSFKVNTEVATVNEDILCDPAA